MERRGSLRGGGKVSEAKIGKESKGITLKK